MCYATAKGLCYSHASIANEAERSKRSIAALFWVKAKAIVAAILLLHELQLFGFYGPM